jgi:hypothetical protein
MLLLDFFDVENNSHLHSCILRAAIYWLAGILHFSHVADWETGNRYQCFPILAFHGVMESLANMQAPFGHFI